MLVLNYVLSSTPTPQMTSGDLRLADEAKLRYDILLGDIIFTAEQCDFSMHWGWVPIIDFAACMIQAKNDLLACDGARSIVDFTESDDKVSFVRYSDEVVVSGSYVSCQANVTLEELSIAVDSFRDRLLEYISLNYPPLFENRELRRILDCR
jgi:hypothetical protein